MLQFDYQLYSILRAFPDNSEKKNEANANMGTQRIGRSSVSNQNTLKKSIQNHKIQLKFS